jgi:DNA polymerase
MDEARRLQYLAAMGIRAWRLRIPATPEPIAAQPQATETAREGAVAAEHRAPARQNRVQEPATQRATDSRAAPVAGPQDRPDSGADRPPAWLDEPPPWSDDELGSTEPLAPAATSPASAAGSNQSRAANAAAMDAKDAAVATMDWSALEARVADCRDCILCETRTNTVFGVGDRNAELMFIGEGPGQDEDRQGEPFVGRAGQLLNKMLQAVGLTRDQVYIANIVKCRPPRNRNPAPDEAAACRAYLERQIALIQPKLIVSLGAVSANNLLGHSDSVGRLRHRLHHYQPAHAGDPIPLIVTYHPSYYLRTPAEKAKGWQDLQRILKTLRGEDPGLPGGAQ